MGTGAGGVRFLFEGYALDLDRRELRRGSEWIQTGPQVFDLLGRTRSPSLAEGTRLQPLSAILTAPPQ